MSNRLIKAILEDGEDHAMTLASIKDYSGMGIAEINEIIEKTEGLSFKTLLFMLSTGHSKENIMNIYKK